MEKRNQKLKHMKHNFFCKRHLNCFRELNSYCDNKIPIDKSYGKLKNKSFSVSLLIDRVDQQILCFVYEPSIWEQKIDR